MNADHGAGGCKQQCTSQSHEVTPEVAPPAHDEVVLSDDDEGAKPSKPTLERKVTGVTVNLSKSFEGGKSAPLSVPFAFNYLDLSRDWTRDAETAPEKQRLMFQEAMKFFLRSLLQGIVAELVLDTGQVVSVEFSLDLDAENFIMVNKRHIRKSIPIQDVRAVEPPHEKWPVAKHADSKCISLLLPEEQFITLRFLTVRGRKFFAACTRVLVVAALRERSAEEGRLAPGKDAAGKHSVGDTEVFPRLAPL